MTIDNFWGIIISSIALIVSILTLIKTTCYNRKTLSIAQKHNMLSVEPLLTNKYEILPSGEIFKEDIEIENSGLGPAIIKSISFRYNGIDYKFLMDIYSVNKTLFADAIIAGTYKRNALGTKHGLAKGDKLLLHEVYYYSNKHQNNLLKLLTEVTLIVEYETMYKEPRSLVEPLAIS